MYRRSRLTGTYRRRVWGLVIALGLLAVSSGDTKAHRSNPLDDCEVCLSIGCPHTGELVCFKSDEKGLVCTQPDSGSGGTKCEPPPPHQ